MSPSRPGRRLQPSTHVAGVDRGLVPAARPLAVFVAAVAGLWLALCAPALAADPTFPALTGRVVDDAHILTPAVVSDLTQRSQQIEASSGRQLVVATVPSLQGLEIEDYGYKLGRAWGVGEKGKNTGAILLVAPTERKVRIEVGYGLEGDLTDALTSVIINQKILPRFKAGDLPGGVQAGGDALADLMALPSDQLQQKSAEASTVQKARAADEDRPSARHGIPVAFIVFIMIFVFSAIFGRGRRGGAAGWLPWVILSAMSGGRSRDDDWGGGGGGGWGGGGGGGGGFSGGGGSFGGGGSSGSW